MKGDARRTFIERAGALGCELALDDFGTGFGGFGYLKNLPVDYLKIDVEFVRDVRTNEASRHVVQAVVGLAAAFGQRTVAEGVEDDRTLQMIREMGVDLAQGYGIGRAGRRRHALRGDLTGLSEARGRAPESRYVAPRTRRGRWRYRPNMNPVQTVVLVRGSGDVGSAVAHLLFAQGSSVVIHDIALPAAPRRGMAFSDAIFEGCLRAGRRPCAARRSGRSRRARTARRCWSRRRELTAVLGAVCPPCSSTRGCVSARSPSASVTSRR